MYARLNNKCPYELSNTYQDFLTLRDLESGRGNMVANNHKFLSTLPESKCSNGNEKIKQYIESPFKVPIRVPEQTKLDQSPLSVDAR